MNTKPTILYVDDERINLEIFEINFEDKYNIILAESGQEGLNALKENTKIEVVLCDFKMPEMNGIDFIKTAKRNYPNIIFFILTGYDVNSEISEAINNQIITKYLSKPFNIYQIEKSIDSAIVKPA